MKRTVLGVLVMGSLVGLGSGGVYYAQGKLAPKPQATAAAEEAALEDARNRQPQPIPVAKKQVPAADPYAATSGYPADPYAASTVQTVKATTDRYAEDYPVAQPAAARPAPLPIQSDELPEVDQLPEVADEHAASMEGDIPDADQMVAAAPAPGASPFSARDNTIPVSTSPSARYPEQPAAAQIVEEPQPTPAAPANEPRRLGESSASPTPAGNPLRAQFERQQSVASEVNSPYEQQSASAPANSPYDPQEYPADADSQDPYAARALPPQATPAAALVEPSEAHFAAEEPQSEGTGRPGDPALNGTQAPALAIEKTAPPEIQIGKPAKFLIKVKNSGTATAHDVEVHDTVPQGTQLIDSSPAANRSPDGQLIWSLGALKPGDEQTIELQLMPTDEGEIGSVATVHFHAQASVRTLATKPLLAMEVTGPEKVNKGEQLSLRIKLSNPGSGAANGIVLTEMVPEGLTHAAGRELEFELGTLKPGETRELDLALTASEAGNVTNIIRAEGEANLVAETRSEIEVVAPQLHVALTGPKLRYLERNATHNISVSNPGTASAKNIDLVAVLPRNLKFVEANNGGQFDEATHAVYWNLEELPPQETGTVKLTTLPLEAGEARLMIKSSSASGLKDEREEIVAIEGLAALNFQLTDLKDPIEVGGETAYEIRVTNQGTKASSNVRLAALLPAGMKPLSAEAPVRYKIEGQRVIFEALRQLAPKAETAFTIKVQAQAIGDQRIQVQVATDEIPDPISKEESTRVYGDE